MPSQNSISFTDESCSITRKNRDYFMGRARVQDFRTSWWCIRNRTSERSERVSFLIQTTSVKIPHKPPAHEVIYLFYMYWVNISSFYLWKLLFIEKKWPANLRNKGQLKPNTIYWLKTVYDDYNIKWPLKHRLVLSIKKLWQKIVTETVQQAGCPHRMSQELAWCVSSSVLQLCRNSYYKQKQ